MSRLTFGIVRAGDESSEVLLLHASIHMEVLEKESVEKRGEGGREEEERSALIAVIREMQIRQISVST